MMKFFKYNTFYMLKRNIKYRGVMDAFFRGYAR